jgi:hypothetical protein
MFCIIYSAILKLKTDIVMIEINPNPVVADNILK